MSDKIDIEDPSHALMLVGRILAAESISEVEAALDEYTDAADEEILDLVSTIADETRESAGQANSFDEFVERFYVPMVTYSGDAEARWDGLADQIACLLIDRLGPVRESQLKPAYLGGVASILSQRAFEQSSKTDAEQVIELTHLIEQSSDPDMIYLSARLQTISYLLLEDLGDELFVDEILDASKRCLSVRDDADIHFHRAQKLRERNHEGDPETALEHYRQALQGDLSPERDAQASLWLQELLADANEKDEALPFLVRAWQQREHLKPLNRWRLMQNLGYPGVVADDERAAHGLPDNISALQAALELAESGDVDDLAMVATWGSLAMRHVENGELEVGRQYFEKAFAKWDTERQNAAFYQDPPLDLIDKMRQITKDYVETLLRLEHDEEALTATFGARCGILELLLGHMPRPPGDKVSPATWNEARAAFERHEHADSEQERASERNRYDELLETIESIDPVAGKILDYEPFDIDDFASVIRPEEAFVSVFPNNHTITAFVLTAPDDSGCVLETVHLGESTFYEAVGIVLDWIVEYEEYRHSGIADFSEITDIAERLSTTFDALAKSLDLDRLAKSLSGLKRVRIVPFYPFSFLPLHALPLVDGTTLADRFEVSYLPTLRFGAVVPESRVFSEKTAVSVVADPQAHTMESLPYATLEAAVTASLFSVPDRRALLERDATLDGVSDLLQEQPIVHLACHGHQGFKELGELYLADGAALTIGDLMRMQIASRLVVLSSCESGLSTALQFADEFLAIPATLLAAGAGAVVSSLWQVEDRAAALVVFRFYKALIREQASPAAALYSAQIWLRDADGPALANECEELLETAARSSIIHVQGALRLRLWADRQRKLEGVCCYNLPFFWAPFYLMGR